MKKLLSILGAATLVASSSAVTVACDGAGHNSDKDQYDNMSFDGEPWLSGPQSIYVKLKGVNILNSGVWAKRVTVEGYKVVWAMIAANILEIGVDEQIMLPDSGVKEIKITYSPDSDKKMQTVLKLTNQSGLPGTKMPYCDNKGIANKELNVFTFNTRNIKNQNDVKISWEDELPADVRMSIANIKDDKLAITFNKSFKALASDEVYRFSFIIGQVHLSSEIIIYADSTLPTFDKVSFINGNNVGPNYITVVGKNLDKLVLPSWGNKTFSIVPDNLSWEIIGANYPNEDDNDYSLLQLNVIPDNPIPSGETQLKLVYDYQGVHIESNFVINN